MKKPYAVVVLVQIEKTMFPQTIPLKREFKDNRAAYLSIRWANSEQQAVDVVVKAIQDDMVWENMVAGPQNDAVFLHKFTGRPGPRFFVFLRMAQPVFPSIKSAKKIPQIACGFIWDTTEKYGIPLGPLAPYIFGMAIGRKPHRVR